MSAAANQDNPSSVPHPIMRVRELINKGGSDGWDQAWQENTTPWDYGQIQPPLREFMESEVGKDILGKYDHGPRALVPGCGKGYDVAYLSSLGYDTWGIDISETALERARGLHPAADPRLSFRNLDFFKFEVPDNAFDLVYDHTFFCAIPIDVRRAWGARMRALVRDEGHLITLVYPIDGARTGGPPYSVDVEVVTDALNGAGGSGAASFKKILDVTPKESAPNHVGRERLVVWQRSHQ